MKGKANEQKISLYLSTCIIIIDIVGHSKDISVECEMHGVVNEDLMNIC